MPLMRGPTTGLGRLFEDPDPVGAPELAAEAFIRQRREQGREAEELAQAARTFLDFALEIPEAKRRLDLDRFAFQRELYDEHGEADVEMVIRKASQIGISAWLYRWLLRWADRGRTGLYLMPKEKQANEFSDMRVKRVLAASDYLRTRTAAAASRNLGVDTKRLKAVGDGFIAFRGSQSIDDLDSIDADVLALDEYDRLHQGNLSDAEQRVSGPLSEGLIRSIGNPSVPGFGISRKFNASDQRWWWVRCPRCNHPQPIKGTETLLDQVDRDRMFLVCELPKCREVLDVRQGEWVATFPDRHVRGYGMSKFVATPYEPHAMARFVGRIVENSKRTRSVDRKTHHNKDLGEPWVDASAGLTDEAIAGAVRDYTMVLSAPANGLLRTAGVDIASTDRGLNVRISEHLDEHTKRALWIGVVDETKPFPGMAGMSAFEQVAQLVRLFNVNMVCVDHAPDGRLARAFVGRFPGRACRVSFASNQKAVAKLNKEDPGLITVRRLEAIDAALDLVRQQKNLLPIDRPEDYDDHLKALVLDTEEDEETGKLTQEWKATGPFDYAMAEVYDVVATHMWYVLREAGATAAVSGSVGSARGADAIQTVQDWQDPDHYAEGPSDEPLSGW